MEVIHKERRLAYIENRYGDRIEADRQTTYAMDGKRKTHWEAVYMVMHNMSDTRVMRRHTLRLLVTALERVDARSLSVRR